MNPDLPHNSREELEASLTALLLGELPPEQAAELRRAIEQDAALAALHQRLKLTIDLVRQTAAHPAGQTAAPPLLLKLSERRRQELLAHFKTVTPKEFARPRRQEWRSPALVAAAAVLVALLALAVFLPALSSGKRKSLALGRAEFQLAAGDATRSGRLGDRSSVTQISGSYGGVVMFQTNIIPYGSRGWAEAKAERERMSATIAQLPGVASAPATPQQQPAAGVLFQPDGRELLLPAPANRTAIVLPAATDVKDTAGHTERAQGRSKQGAGTASSPLPSGPREQEAGTKPSAPLASRLLEPALERAGATSLARDGSGLNKTPQPHAAELVPRLDAVATQQAARVSDLPNAGPQDVQQTWQGVLQGDRIAFADDNHDRKSMLGTGSPPVQRMTQNQPNSSNASYGFGMKFGGGSFGGGMPGGGRGGMDGKGGTLAAPAQSLAAFGAGKPAAQPAQGGSAPGQVAAVVEPLQEQIPILGDKPIPGTLYYREAAKSPAEGTVLSRPTDLSAAFSDGIAKPGTEGAELKKRELSLDVGLSDASAKGLPGQNRPVGSVAMAGATTNGQGLGQPGTIRGVGLIVDDKEQTSTQWSAQGQSIWFGPGQPVDNLKMPGSTTVPDAYFSIAPDSRRVVSNAFAGRYASIAPSAADAARNLGEVKDKEKLRRVGGGARQQTRGGVDQQLAEAQAHGIGNYFNGIGAINDGKQLAQAQSDIQALMGAPVPAINDGKQLAQAQAEAERLSQPRSPVVPAAPQVEPDQPATKRLAAPAPIPQPEVQTRENAFSTFSLNVSDVSFKLAAASLEQGRMPEPATVRSEEFINAFDYRDPEAPAGVPVAFAFERARYPFAQNRDLLRFSLKTAAQGRQAGRPLNVVLLLDNSGSMERADRVRIIHEALRVLAAQLQPQDTLSVVTFARTARLWVDGVPGSQAGQVAEKVSELTPQGGTNLEEALNLAYRTALRHYLANGINRIVLLTDGAANLGSVEPEALKQKVEAHRQQGVALDCFGIGWEGYNDDLLEVLSRNGDGRYGFLNTPEEAASEFAGKLAGALRVAASNVKVQVEFNPSRVKAYRQLGYARHQLAKEQFRDNTVAAAQIGAAEAGNALYVIETDPRGNGPLGVVRVRYQLPGTGDYREQEWTVPYTGSAAPLEQASAALRLAAVAGAFSEWLVSSPFAAEATPDRLLGYLRGVPEVYAPDARPRRLEWMLRQAQSLGGK
ncbi:MAG TPA: von Willebrand factor type A domain-containing protein [Dongiaceae bacterium]|nr:von Willebrand factor type A domain-containing protein [Dongiaceae bacterium]